MSGSTHLIEVINLSKKYKERRGRLLDYAVSGVEFTLDAGETLGIVGESGSGKSTVARCVAGLTEPSSGAVLFEGKPLFRADEAESRYIRRNIQMVFQDPFASLNPKKAIEDIVSEPLRSYGVSRPQRSSEVGNLLAKVGLSLADRGRYPRSFSGGQRQRIGIARAIALKPKVLVADEPTSALDVSIQAQILNLLSDLQFQQRLAMLFISHDLTVVGHMASRVLVMYRGKVVESGATRRVYRHPAHPYTETLLAAVPVATVSTREVRPAVGRGRPMLEDAEMEDKGCPFRCRCPYAEAICREQAPLLQGTGREQAVACHFPRSAVGKSA